MLYEQIMNRTTKDLLGLFVAMAAVYFTVYFINPDYKNKGQISNAFIGIAYLVGRGQNRVR